MKHLLFLFLALTSLSLFGKAYKGAEYRTKDAFTYGRFETRMKTAGKEGMLASFFTYHEITSTTEWNEIDIEILGRYANDVQFNPITKGQVNHVHHSYTDFNPALDYHDYAFEWTPDYVAWFIDGVEVHRQTGDHIKTLDLPQKLMMNVWNPDQPNWVGAWSDNILPAFSYYDWIKYSSYTPGTGDYGTNSNFTLQWVDNLDGFDSTRWEKATHTFGGNNCDFIPENIIFKDGKMILALTNSTDIGYTDVAAPVPLWARAEKNRITVYFSEEVNSTAASNKSNYSTSGVTISSAALQPDNRTVFLSTSDINLEQSHNLIVLNQKDNFGNTDSPKAVTIANAHPLQFPLKVNVGGTASGDFLGDQDWGPGVEYGAMSGDPIVYSSALQISGTPDDSAYTSDRTNFPTYRIRVPNGTYKVTMLFAEKSVIASGKRIFDVLVEGKMIEDNLDVFAKVGGNKPYQVIVTTQVTDEILDLYFQAEVSVNALSGFIVEQIGTDVNDVGGLQPESFQLMQNFPNPFNGTTTITFNLPAEDNISFEVFNLLGEIVYQSNLGELQKGVHQLTWNGEASSPRMVSSGFYLYRIRGRNASAVKKLLLLK